MFHDRQMTETDMINLYPRCKRETQRLSQLVERLNGPDDLERTATQVFQAAVTVAGLVNPLRKKVQRDRGQA